MLALLVEEAEQQIHGLLVGDDLEFMGILEVHNLVADVIGGLYQVNQRMANEAQGLANG